MAIRDLLTKPGKPGQDTGPAVGTSSGLRVFLFGNRFKPGFLRQLLVYGLLFLLAIVFLLPFYWMLNTALKPGNQVFSLPPAWLPQPIKFSK